MTYIPGGSSTDARFAVWEGDTGDGTVGPFSLTHSLNTRTVDVLVRKNMGVAGLTAAANGAVIDVENHLLSTDQKNTIVLAPDEAWGLNEMHVLVKGTLGSADLTPPTVPTLTAGSISSTTIAVTATSSGDATGFNWFRGGVLQGSTATGAFTYTGLVAGTLYSLTATATDAAGNVSAVSTAITPTTAAGSVMFQAVSSLGSGAVNFNPNVGASCSITTVTGVGLRVVAAVLAYNSIGASGSATRVVTYDGFAMTELTGAFIIDTTYYCGLWIITPTTFGAKTIACDISGAGNAGRLLWLGAASYINVGATAGGVAAVETAGVGQTVASSDPNEILVNGMVGGTTFGSYSQTAKIGPVNVPSQFLCGVLGQAVGGASRTFSNDQPGWSATIRLTP